MTVNKMCVFPCVNPATVRSSSSTGAADYSRQTVVTVSPAVTNTALCGHHRLQSDGRHSTSITLTGLRALGANWSGCCNRRQRRSAGKPCTGWTSAPILSYRVLQDPGAYADTLTLRFDLKTALNGVAAQTEHPTDDAQRGESGRQGRPRRGRRDLESAGD